MKVAFFYSIWWTQFLYILLSKNVSSCALTIYIYIYIYRVVSRNSFVLYYIIKLCNTFVKIQFDWNIIVCVCVWYFGGGHFRSSGGFAAKNASRLCRRSSAFGAAGSNASILSLMAASRSGSPPWVSALLADEVSLFNRRPAVSAHGLTFEVEVVDDDDGVERVLGGFRSARHSGSFPLTMNTM